MNIQQSCKEVLSDVEYLVTHISDIDFTQSLPMMFDASIGQHTRHILDGYLCLMAQEKTCSLDYELRERNPVLETKPKKCIETLNKIYAWLDQISDDGLLHLQINYNTSGNDNLEPVSVKSNLYRELVHNIEHTIHHLALIKVAVNLMENPIHLPSHFGIAPSTIRYKEKMLSVESI